jgi:TolB-like protein/DNA-binding winged helix-turn-helix (wHTH) protein
MRTQEVSRLMPEPSPLTEPLLFSEFEVDVRARELRKHGIRVKLQDQPFRVLQILLEHPGELVTRDELQRQIWPSDTFVDFDRGLNNAVKRLREALSDSAEEPRYIETLPKRGYRFIAPVQAANGHNAPKAKAAVVPIETTGAPAGEHVFRSHRVRAAMVAVLTVVILLIAVLLSFRDRLAGKVAAAPIRSIAVLPLQNLSGDPNQDYFTDGMTEELITELSHLKGLTVTSRTSVMRYKKPEKSLPQIARELNVEGVVEGSVLRSGERVRITAQLISARTDANLWAETYDRSLQDSLAVQEEVAIAIASKIRTTMGPSAAMQFKPVRPINLKAHEAYLLGQHEQDVVNLLSNHERTTAIVEEHRRRAIEYYRKAIYEDPNYGPAYLALSDPYDPNDVEAKARKALEFDNSLSEAHLEVAAVLLFRDMNWQGAEREFQQAVEVNPSYAPAHQGYAYFLDAVGRLDEGLSEYHRAQEIDPANDHLAAALYSRRDYGRLIELELSALATNPQGDNSGNALAHKVLMVAYARTGKFEESIDEMSKGVACMGFHDLAEEIRRGYVAGGYEGGLRAYLKGAAKSPDWALHWVDIYVYAELKDYDHALSRLARLNKDDPSLWMWVTEADCMPTLASLRVEPMWDRLHSDSRFEQLARKIGLPPDSAAYSEH